MDQFGSTTDALAAARGGAVVVPRPDLWVLPLGGRDVLPYLHAVSSQHTAELGEGDAAEALLLSPKGKVDFAFRLAVRPDGVLLDTEAEAAAALAERLARFVFRYDVVVGAPGPGALSVLGPDAAAVVAAAGLPTPPAEHGHAAVARPGLAVHRGPLGLDLVGPAVPASLAALDAAGVAGAPEELWELIRIERGLPRWGRELTDDVIAEEAGLLGTHVHLDKGCYPGQETVARVHNLGQVQRRLAGLRFDGGELPPARTELTTEDGRRAGQLRSGVHHPELGPIALAYVRRTVAPGQLVLAGEVRGRVVELPFPTVQRPAQASA
ncbi:MAG TPA: folate-binding protein [Actinomycetes bacterium]